MAYFPTTASAPFAALRHATVTAAQAVGVFFAGVNRALVINSTSHQRLQQVERLQAKTDAELAALGIKREDIVQHVFRDFF